MTDYTDRFDEEGIDAEVLDALLLATPDLPPPEGLRAKVLERVRRAAAGPGDFITLLGTQGWEELMPGLEVKRLCVDERAGFKSFLLRAQPGVSLPGHDHQGYEECMVLEGEFSMGDITLRAGDYHAAAAGTAHPESRTATGVTVYLRAAIGDYPGI